MEIITPIRIDMQRTARMPEIYAKQGDACTRKVQISMFDGGDRWRPGKSDVAIRFCKSDGTGGIYDKLPDGTKAYAYPTAAPDDTIAITLAPEVLTCPGDVLVDVVFSGSTEVLATFSFVVHVQESPMAGITTSNSYYNYQSLADINRAIDEAKAAAAGSVKSVNGVKPGSDGNVAVNVGAASVNGRTGAVQLPINAFAGCTTAADVASKEVAEVAGFYPLEGAVLAVRFLHSNTAENVRLNYDGTELLVLDRITNERIAPGDITAGIYRFMRRGSNWILLDKALTAGADGGHWIPSVDGDGNLTWEASREGMGDAPAAANIRGLPGATGGYYKPKITQPETGKMRIAFEPSEDGMPTIAPAVVDLPTAPATEGVIIPMYTCNTNGSDAEKVIRGDAGMPADVGAIFAVQFSNDNSADPTQLALIEGSGAYPKRLRIALALQGQTLVAKHLAAGVHYFAVANDGWAYLLNPNIRVEALVMAVERGLEDA